MIRKFDEFLKIVEAKKKPRESYSYACVMLFLDMPYWKDYTDVFDEKDISQHEDSDGLINKNKAHVTILYGLHNDIPKEEIEKVIKNIDGNKFKIKLKDVSYFETPNYDVVKIAVEDEYLMELNKEFKKFPFSSDYPDYKPHITLAYVNKGEAKKYCDGRIDKLINDKITQDETVFKIKHIVYSINKEKYVYELDIEEKN
jgi:2'-5' RNA ligase